ncbi:hypothetical protein ACFFGT_05255 [Mucilaginibacter angelicae]|uniref:Bacteriocin n=1 Tax=Mucilaginibacter angelicae TaxID=869718 RepID=A0ABV6L2K8_9SPHI
MKKEKLGLNAIKNVLSRAELKKIMAGSGNRCDYCGPGGYICCACYLNDNPNPSLKGPYCADSCTNYCTANGLGAGFHPVSFGCPATCQ